MLPTLRTLGWEPVVLAVDSAFVEAPVEQDLLLTIPMDVRIVRCRAVPQRYTRRLGFGGLAWRSRWSLMKAGDALLKAEQYDLVFFSTTEFGLLSLGRRWKRRFKVPFVIDIQDPWVNTHYEETGNPPPGGPFKHWATQALARLEEGPTLVDAARIISVSPRYPEDLLGRYPKLSRSSFDVIPFGGARRDFDVMRKTGQTQSLFDPQDGRLHWVYAGTAPPGIRTAVMGFFLALQRAFRVQILQPGSVCVHFIGTDYSPEGTARPRVMAFANELDMATSVFEHPSRIPYLQTLRCLSDADALLVFGWNDPGYTASKLYPNILAGKPLLSVLHEESSGNQVMASTKAGTAVSFKSSSSAPQVAEMIFERWLENRAFETQPSTVWENFSPFSAESMTERVASVFSNAVS